MWICSVTSNFIFGLLVAGMSPFTAMAESAPMDVTITYRERIALPPDAEVDVELLDTSRADAAAVRMASQRFRIESVPLSVTLTYDADLIDERFSYSVAARIYAGDRVLFRTTAHHAVLTRGAPDTVELMLERMPTAASAASGSTRIVGLAWEVYEIAGRALIAKDAPTLTIDDEGRLGLYAGCNRFTGKAQIDGDKITFPQPLAGTRMACLEARERLERDTLDALSTVTGFHRADQLLALTNASGVSVMRLREKPE